MLGVCYYPEQWPESVWEDDARRMRALGISYVRIGEFAWSAIEPEPGRFDWGWMDRAIDVLARAGLKIVIGSPTATPPKWLVDRFPDILPVDARGRVRRFGSRRHYCFSSETYLRESRRIVEALTARYGLHEAVTGWQCDNEYGCHDTVRSYSPDAARAFREWLRRRYGSVEALNAAWGNRFWSMSYGSFGEIDPPAGAVTETNPAHRLDFQRFSSDQVARFNEEQASIIRRHSPGRFVTHNFMGAFTDFDHHKLAGALDFASWDSYPLGFTDSADSLGLSEAERLEYAYSGHPDVAAFHHDLYRGMSGGRFWVMEQQPGPVNWAAWNPAPAAGMVRLWTWEALAHGAQVVSFFRWRQAPFAQEQMHAGLNRPDNMLDIGGQEAETVGRELSSDWWQEASARPCEPAPVALVFDYESVWAQEIQPQGRRFSPLAHAFAWYSALRRLGVDVDIVPAGRDLSPYRAVFVPGLAIVSDEALRVFSEFEGHAVFGIRTGSKTRDFQIPAELPPGKLQELLPLKVVRVESLRPGLMRSFRWGNENFDAQNWVETLEAGPGVEVLAQGAHGPALVRAGRRYYAGVWPTRGFAIRLASDVLAQAGVATTALNDSVRMRRRGGITFAFNYGCDSHAAPAPARARYVLGAQQMGAHNLAAWES